VSGVIAFVFSSPRHHAEMLLPVVRNLQTQGHACRVISIAEFRGMSTPRTWDVNGASVHRLMPVRRPIKVAPPSPPSGGARRRVDVRGLAQHAIWTAGVGPRLRWLLRDSRAVVIPNDAAFPYLQLAQSLRARGTPFVLMQEGIRFRLPIDDKLGYGMNGADRVCVWGAGSAEYFASLGVPSSSLCVTGNPRFDRVDVERWKVEGTRVLASLGLARPPLLFLSNPIEAQGFGTLDFKLKLFATFLEEAAPTLRRRDVPIVVKLHAYEDPAGFRATAARLGVSVIVADDVPLFALLASARGAVVTASTVGLEALVFGLPLGVLQIPGHGYAFEYVQRGAAVGLEPGRIAAGVDAILDGGPRSDAQAFVQRHLANRGLANERVAQAILSVVGRG